MADKGPAVEIPRLFSRLKRATDDEDDEQALELCGKILELAPDDADALHCQLIALIHLAKFEAALDLIRTINKKRAAGEGPLYKLEEAYCLYRQEKYDATTHILSTLPADDLRVTELLAQVAYRQEQYVRAMEAYQTLLNEEKHRQERVANYYAAVFLAGGDTEVGVVVSDTMEQCFNLACCQLVRGRQEQAMQLLDRAEGLYRESLEEEGLTEEEIVEEMAVIEVQKGYCFHVQEAVKEAMSCYNSVLKLRPDDPGLIAVLSNNILVLNGDRDVFDSKKKVKILANEGSSRKLTRLQKQKILFNRCMFALQNNQLERCRELGGKLKAAQSTSDLSVLAEVALLNREKKLSGAVEILQNHVKSSSEASVLVYCTLAQLYLNQGSPSKALAALRTIPAYANYVGVAAMLASQHAHLGEVGVAMDILDRMLESWMEKGAGQVGGASAFGDLVKQVAKFQLSHSRPEAAAAILERALSYHDDMSLRALLISAYSQYDPQKAEQASQQLPAFSGRGQLDVDSLERTPVFRHSRKPAPARSEVGRASEVGKTKKKKKRKPRLPKNYDPSVTPDPERWLPLRERSYYRKSRRKGGSAPIRGTQGTSAASANLMSQLDASKPAAVKQAAETVAEASSEGQSPRAKPHPQASKKKAKKKKGGKW